MSEKQFNIVFCHCFAGWIYYGFDQNESAVLCRETNGISFGVIVKNDASVVSLMQSIRAERQRRNLQRAYLELVSGKEVKTLK